MVCPRCHKNNTLILLFDRNIVYCLGCKPLLETSDPFRIEAGMYLHLEFLTMGCFWAVKYSQLGMTDKMIYVLKKDGLFFGNLVDYLSGVVYLDCFNGDEEGLKELQKALYGAFGVQNLHIGGEGGLLMYLPT